MTYKIVQGVIGADVLNAGTFTVNYPDGTNAGTFYGALGHSMLVNGKLLAAPKQFAVAFGASNITITNNSGATIPAGSYYLELEQAGDGATFAGIARTTESALAFVLLGAPDAAAAAGIAAAQAVAAAGNLSLNGALVAGGAAVFDVPRGVQLVSTAAGDTTQTATVTGTDEYGVTLTETIALNGTVAVFGKKAFLRVTKIAISAATAGNVSAGTSDVLGLPLFLSDAGLVVKELRDGAALTTGVFAAGDKNTASATTGDVRGTYAPAAATDGAASFRLAIICTDPTFKGLDQA